jgi:hypothetical protein
MKDFLRSYVSSVRRATTGVERLTLDQSHAIRVACAIKHLPLQPLRDYGFNRIIYDAKRAVSVMLGPDVLEWLPAAEVNFHGL